MHFQKKIKILVAPLDWGLGHTTRCIPIINSLLNQNIEVVLAGNTVQHKILTEEFPNCTFLALPGYNVKYNKMRFGFLLKMLIQVPRILNSVIKERRWLRKVVKEYEIDGVISDNRFGLHQSTIPNVFVTHQLCIKTGCGAFVDWVARQINYWRINKYNYCWIPDFPDANSLAGALSHPPKMPQASCSYVGPLSRLEGVKPSLQGDAILFIISGPEPQRSIFETKIFDQIHKLSINAIVVRGLPGASKTSMLGNIVTHNHLPKSQLGDLIKSAKLVVCRSGYSSVMDINAVGVKSILIPTPGQTEQEYLASYLHEKGFALTASQQNFELAKLLNHAEIFSYNKFITANSQLLQTAIKDFIKVCKERRRLSSTYIN